MREAKPKEERLENKCRERKAWGKWQRCVIENRNPRGGIRSQANKKGGSVSRNDNW
jgi:hypothetical protein